MLLSKELDDVNRVFFIIFFFIGLHVIQQLLFSTPKFPYVKWTWTPSV